MGARFDPADIAELRRLVAVVVSEEVRADGTAPGDDALVQLNVRVRAGLKRRIEALARERRCGFAEIIERAIEHLQRTHP